MKLKEAIVENCETDLARNILTYSQMTIPCNVDSHLIVPGTSLSVGTGPSRGMANLPLDN